MGYKLFNQGEEEIFSKIRENAKEDLKTWNIANLFFPVATILITIMFYFFSPSFVGFKEYSFVEFKSVIKSIVNLLLNGSIPLIGLGLLVSSGYFLLKFDKKKEQDFGLKIFNTRQKMLSIAFVYYLFLSSIFAIQAIFNPFSGIAKPLFMILLTALGMVFSFKISNKLFLLQEEYIDQSFAEGITTGVKSIKDNLQ